MRDEYRDNDDSQSQKRRSARENVGNNARGTDADPKGPEFNDKTRRRDDRPDEYDKDLSVDN